MIRFSFSVFFILLLLAVGCGKPDKNKTQTAGYCLSDSLAKIIRFDTVKTKPLFREVRMTGKISFDEDKVVHVFPPVSGIVQDVTVSLGDYVQPGQVLAKIKSSDIAAYNSQYATSLANLSIAKRTQDFTEELFKSGAASEKDLSVARDNTKVAEAEVNRIKQVLSLYGGGSAEFYYLKSPIPGFIVEKKITEGTIIRPDASDYALTISDLKEVWVLGNAFERDLEGIEVGDPVDVKTLAYEKTYKGKVNKISRTIDPSTKANKVRVIIDNPDFKLQPEMYATVTVHAPIERDLSAIPAEASIFNENRYFVVAYKDKCHLEVLPISPQSIVGNTMYLNNTITPGTVIVSKYQLLIYNELSGLN
ncbi:MAG: efflux RND transporter periplasmic adaptor subunit [Bacteroidetes bacterium]|nr:efflux RND transporter periplasmic adaptor subunit [Bacteroidota bacterium]